MLLLINVAEAVVHEHCFGPRGSETVSRATRLTAQFQDLVGDTEGARRGCRFRLGGKKSRIRWENSLVIAGLAESCLFERRP